VNINGNSTHEENIPLGEQLEVRTAALSGNKGETTLYVVVGETKEEFTLCTLSSQCPQFSVNLQFQITETPVTFGVKGPGKITLVGERHQLFDDDDEEDLIRLGADGEEDELMDGDEEDEVSDDKEVKPQQQQKAKQPQQQNKEQKKNQLGEKPQEKPQQQNKKNNQNQKKENKPQEKQQTKQQQNGSDGKKNEHKPNTPKNNNQNQKRPITPGNEQNNNKKQKV